ncbi:hypothetical protein TKK_0012124 [Trichogramma kaykai]
MHIKSSLFIVLCGCCCLVVGSPAPMRESHAGAAVAEKTAVVDTAALLEQGANGGENVDRAKKQASTTFCVEIRQNKPTQVDCAEVKQPTTPEPTPAPTTPAPVVYVVQQQPPSPPEPCEPEIAAYMIQHPAEIIYAPTGKCLVHGQAHAQQPAPVQQPQQLQVVPQNHAHIHVVPANQAQQHLQQLQQLQQPAGPQLQIVPQSLQHLLRPPSSIMPGPPPQGPPPQGPSLVPQPLPPPQQPQPPVVVPQPQVPQSIKCTCNTAGVSGAVAGQSTVSAGPSNEQLAMSFLQGLQRNAQAQGQKLAQAGANLAALPNRVGAAFGRNVPSVIHPGHPGPQLSYGQKSASDAQAPVNPLLPGGFQSQLNAAFGLNGALSSPLNSRPVYNDHLLPPGGVGSPLRSGPIIQRLSRDMEDQIKQQQQSEAASATSSVDDASKTKQQLSPADMIGKMMKNNPPSVLSDVGGEKARVARYLYANNQLDDEE